MSTDHNKRDKKEEEIRRQLKKSGSDIQNYDYLLALAGNPNTGKSTVFNYLTGLKQHTGNWPGKTVARAEGSYSYGGEKYKIVDLPGTYSLLSTSEDEQIARDFILFGQPSVTLIVADATRLERNLNLTLQILEITDRAILVVNLIDEAERNHISLDLKRLSKHLRIPVCGTSARSGLGMKELIETIHNTVHATDLPTPYRIQSLSGEYAVAVEEMTKMVKNAYPELPNARWVALRLLEGDQSILQAMDNGELGKI